MWLDNESDGCIYDTVDCGHICWGCYNGLNKCPECGNTIDHDEEKCSECGFEKDKIFFKGDE